MSLSATGWLKFFAFDFLPRFSFLNFHAGGSSGKFEFDDLWFKLAGTPNVTPGKGPGVIWLKNIDQPLAHICCINADGDAKDFVHANAV